MKKIITILFLTSSFIIASLAFASKCYQISNSDSKNLCLAKTKKQYSYCYQIRNTDKKNYCLAVVKGQKSYCYQIKNNDNKKMCLAEF